MTPHHAVADQTQEEDAQTYTQQGILYDLQHRHAGDELLLKHVSGCLVKLSRLGGSKRRESR